MSRYIVKIVYLENQNSLLTEIEGVLCVYVFVWVNEHVHVRVLAFLDTR
jgi:hypothetical protein